MKIFKFFFVHRGKYQKFYSGGEFQFKMFHNSRVMANVPFLKHRPKNNATKRPRETREKEQLAEISPDEVL